MKHNCYISFKTENVEYKKYIQEEIDVDMIDKSLNEPIQSNVDDYILKTIRKEYLADSTVTIFLIGALSSEKLGWDEQKFIKRELQASLYNGENNTRSGILGVVLPEMSEKVYKGKYRCSQCGNEHNHVAINEETVIKEFSYNYYIPNNKCYHSEEDRYCVLVDWENFVATPNKYIDAAFAKRDQAVASKVRVKGGD